MREPTAKEEGIITRCLEGLQADVQAVLGEPPSRDVHPLGRRGRCPLICPNPNPLEA